MICNRPREPTRPRGTHASHSRHKQRDDASERTRSEVIANHLRSIEPGGPRRTSCPAPSRAFPARNRHSQQPPRNRAAAKSRSWQALCRKNKLRSPPIPIETKTLCFLREFINFSRPRNLERPDGFRSIGLGHASPFNVSDQIAGSPSCEGQVFDLPATSGQAD